MRVLLIGQSNAGRYYQTFVSGTFSPGAPAFPGSRFFPTSPAAWATPNRFTAPGANSLITALEIVENEAVEVVQYAIGGSTVGEWLGQEEQSVGGAIPRTDGDRFIDDLKTHLTASAIALNSFDLIIWTQGEADATAGTTGAEYQIRLQNLVNAVYFEVLGYPSGIYGGLPPFYIGRLPVTDLNDVAPNRDVILAAQEAFVTTRAYTKIFGLSACPGVDVGVHFPFAVYAKNAHLAAEVWNNAPITNNPNNPIVYPDNITGTIDLSGATTNQFIQSGDQHSLIIGGSGGDYLYGGGSFDKGFPQTIIAGDGNNFIKCGDATTRIVPVNPNSATPGNGFTCWAVGSVNPADIANVGPKTYVLGDPFRPYFNTGVQASHCVIHNFIVGTDRIELHGAAGDYTFVWKQYREVDNPGSPWLGHGTFNATHIFYQTATNLVGVLRLANITASPAASVDFMGLQIPPTETSPVFETPKVVFANSAASRSYVPLGTSKPERIVTAESTVTIIPFYYD